MVDKGGSGQKKEEEGGKSEKEERAKGKLNTLGSRQLVTRDMVQLSRLFRPSFLDFLSFPHLPSFLFLSPSPFFTLTHLRLVGISFLPFRFLHLFLPLLCISISSFSRDASRAHSGLE